jgi:hypothetical protein
MYIKMNRAACQTNTTMCQRCMEQFLENPRIGHRRCFELIVDDGRREIVIDLITARREITLELDQAEQFHIAREGWDSAIGVNLHNYI